jgi:hypothetical protein
MSIKCNIIADSINPTDCRITTFILRFPRIVLAELNTHRALSKNSASSRAIPFEKMLEMVKTDPFIPIRFQKDHKGMQGTEYFTGAEHDDCVSDWLTSRDAAISTATSFKFPVTKQLRNRLLEPYMWHTVILTATDLENLFALRAHKDAEIHFCELANKMLEAYNLSDPTPLEEGQWHIPFGSKIDRSKLNNLICGSDFGLTATSEQIEDTMRKIAVARCARISYFNFDGNDDYAADIKLCDRLFSNIPKHLSPTEHVAQSVNTNQYFGNFRGWKQYRKFFTEETLTDSRVIKKYFKRESTI